MNNYLLTYCCNSIRDAWNELGKIGKEEAMRRYVQKVLEIAKKIKGKASDDFRKEIET